MVACVMWLPADPMPTPQMYRNDPFAVKGKLTVPQSLRSTSQLEGYHGASLNHVLAGYNVSAQVAVPQLTLTNDSWNTEREVRVSCVLVYISCMWRVISLAASLYWCTAVTTCMWRVISLAILLYWCTPVTTCNSIPHAATLCLECTCCL